MKLSTRSRYGTRMLLDIAMHGSEDPVSISDISERLDLPVKYLEKLIRPLKGANYITSRRGPGGGHQLSCAPERISIGDIVRVLEGKDGLTDCAGITGNCPNQEQCLTRRLWVSASQAMFRELDAVSVRDLMNDARRFTQLATSCPVTFKVKHRN